MKSGSAQPPSLHWRLEGHLLRCHKGDSSIRREGGGETWNMPRVVSLKEPSLSSSISIKSVVCLLGRVRREILKLHLYSIYSISQNCRTEPR